MYFQSPEFSKAASATRIRAVKSVFVLSAFDPAIGIGVLWTLHSLQNTQMTAPGAANTLNNTTMKCSEHKASPKLIAESKLNEFLPAAADTCLRGIQFARAEILTSGRR